VHGHWSIDESTIVLAIVRDDAPLQIQDKKFIEGVLEPRLRSATASEEGERSAVSRIRTLLDPGAGALLVSRDKRATLVVVELKRRARGVPELRRLAPIGMPLAGCARELFDFTGRTGSWRSAPCQR
jgi:hypothetical protein